MQFLDFLQSRIRILCLKEDFIFLKNPGKENVEG